MRTQGFEDLLQGIRRVRVVHDDQRLVATAQPLHAPDRTAQAGQQAQDTVQRIFHGQQRADDRQQVAEIETTQQRAT
ncbi:hypothetical protein D3C77_744990 [compost metagenome]